jgi:hypothetical protein
MVFQSALIDLAEQVKLNLFLCLENAKVCSTSSSIRLGYRLHRPVHIFEPVALGRGRVVDRPIIYPHIGS